MKGAGSSGDVPQHEDNQWNNPGPGRYRAGINGGRERLVCTKIEH